MTRILEITLTGDGSSEAFDLTQDAQKVDEYSIGVVATSFGTMSAMLEFSFDKNLWGIVKQENGASATFLSNGVFLVPTGLYYRVNVGNFSTAIGPRFQAEIA